MKTSFAQQQSIVATPSVNHMNSAGLRYSARPVAFQERGP